MIVAEIIFYTILAALAWIGLGVVLRELRIWRRTVLLRRLNSDRNMYQHLTEKDVWGDELRSRWP